MKCSELKRLGLKDILDLIVQQATAGKSALYHDDVSEPLCGTWEGTHLLDVGDFSIHARFSDAPENEDYKP